MFKKCLEMRLECVNQITAEDWKVHCSLLQKLEKNWNAESFVDHIINLDSKDDADVDRIYS
jgi:hypothetical protein